MQGSNFRTSDPGLAVVWPAVEADMQRIAEKFAPAPVPPRWNTPSPGKGMRLWERLADLSVGERRSVWAAKRPSWVVLYAERISGARFAVTGKGDMLWIVERVA